jgi:hypothetical protein
MYIVIAVVLVIGVIYVVADLLDRKGYARPIPDPLPHFNPIDPTQFQAEQNKLLMFAEDMTAEDPKSIYDIKTVTRFRQELSSEVLKRILDDMMHVVVGDTEQDVTAVLLTMELLRAGQAETRLAGLYDKAGTIKWINQKNVAAKVRDLLDSDLIRNVPAPK